MDERASACPDSCWELNVHNSPFCLQPGVCGWGVSHTVLADREGLA